MFVVMVDFLFLCVDLDIKNLLYGIFNGGINLKFMLSQVLSKLENLQKLFAKMKLPSTKILDAQFLEKFPINSSDALKYIEECIILDEFDFGYKLVRKHFYYVKYINLEFSNLTVLLLIGNLY